MIISNGVLSYAKKSNLSDVDEYGQPVAYTLEWSDDIPCLIETTSDDRRTVYDDGEFRKISATVYTETKIPLDAIRLRLTRYSDDLGEREIASIEECPIVGAYKILVV